MDVLVCWEVSGRINMKMLTVVISSLWNSGWFRSLIILIFLIYFSQSSYNEYELMIWLKQQKGRKMVIFCHTNVVCKWRAQLFCMREDKLLTGAGESRLHRVRGDRMKSQYNCLELKEGKETPLASRGSHGLREDFETVRRRSPYKLTSYCIILPGTHLPSPFLDKSPYWDSGLSWPAGGQFPAFWYIAKLWSECKYIWQDLLGRGGGDLLS